MRAAAFRAGTLRAGAFRATAFLRTTLRFPLAAVLRTCRLTALTSRLTDRFALVVLLRTALPALAAWVRAQLDAGVEDLHAAARRDFDHVLLQAALEHSEGHRGDAALKLGLGRNTVTRKLGPSRTRR